MPVMIPGPHSDPIPALDEDLAAFADMFAGMWLPGNFNVVLPLAITIDAAADAFRSALNLASAPESRTVPSIAAKQAARVALVAILRGAIRSAQAAFLAGIASEELLNVLGVRANSLVRNPISAPLFPPFLGIDTVSIGSTNLRLTQVDQATGLAVSTRRYAYGIAGVALERKVGAGDWEVVGLRRTVKINDSVVGLAAGTLLQYRGRYQTGTGLVSPFSAAVSAAVLV